MEYYAIKLLSLSSKPTLYTQLCDVGWGCQASLWLHVRLASCWALSIGGHRGRPPVLKRKKGYSPSSSFPWTDYLSAFCSQHITQAILLYPLAVVLSHSNCWIQCAVSSSSVSKAHFISLTILPARTCHSFSLKIWVPSPLLGVS